MSKIFLIHTNEILLDEQSMQEARDNQRNKGVLPVHPLAIWCSIILDPTIFQQIMEKALQGGFHLLGRHPGIYICEEWKDEHICIKSAGRGAELLEEAGMCLK